MAAVLTAIEELPRQNASRVKNKWGEVVRLVQQEGTVAVTNHAKVEMVLVHAETYNQMVKDAQVLQGREQKVLDELNQRFDARLATLQRADVGQRIDGVLDAQGRLRTRPKVGATF